MSDVVLKRLFSRLDKSAACATPGEKKRSGGMGKGLATGKGEGPIGIPAGMKKTSSWISKVSTAIAAEPEIAKEAGIKDLLRRGAEMAGKAGKYAKWGGLGLGAYLLLKALEGVHEAKQESTLRGY